MITAINRKSIKWWASVIAFVILFGFIFSYGYIKMQTVVRGVKLRATLNQENNSSLAKVTGVAPNVIHLTLNGREISIDTHGKFGEQVILPTGFSVVTLKAVDKFGKEREKEFAVVNNYKENREVALINKK